jgi:hypothetical protein
MKIGYVGRIPVECEPKFPCLFRRPSGSMFFATDGSEVFGPYPDEMSAKHDLEMYILSCRKRLLGLVLFTLAAVAIALIIYGLAQVAGLAK